MVFGFFGFIIEAHFLEQVLIAPRIWAFGLVNVVLQTGQTRVEDPLLLIVLRSLVMTKNKKWIQEAIKPQNVGKLKKSLGVKAGENIPAGKLAKAAKSSGKLGKRARLAQTLKGLK